MKVMHKYCMNSNTVVTYCSIKVFFKVNVLIIDYGIIIYTLVWILFSFSYYFIYIYIYIYICLCV